MTALAAALPLRRSVAVEVHHLQDLALAQLTVITGALVAIALRTT